MRIVRLAIIGAAHIYDPKVLQTISNFTIDLVAHILIFMKSFPKCHAKPILLLYDFERNRLAAKHMASIQGVEN